MRSAFLAWVRTQLLGVRERFLTPPADVGGPPARAGETSEQAAGLQLALMAKLDEEARSAGIPVLFLVIPRWFPGQTIRLGSDLGWMLEGCRTRQLQCIDVASALIASGQPLDKLYFTNHDHHFRPQAHRIAAQVLLPGVLRGISPSEPHP